MKLKNTRLASMLTSALLLATSLVTIAAAPANADAPAPATLFDYETYSVGAGGWSSQGGYSSANDNSAWSNYVDAATGLPAGGSATGTKAVKAQKGNGISNTRVGEIANGSSLISSTSRIATMNFYAPEAGKIVALSVSKDDYSGGQSTTASALTVVGWQTLTFEFSSSIDFSQSFNRAAVSYDTASSVGGNGNNPNHVYWYDDVSFNGATPAPLAPATLYNYESNTVGMSSWGNILGYTSANDGSAWGNYVNASDQAGGSVTGTKMVKGQKGNATSNTAISADALAASRSLIAYSTRTVTMNFYAPAAGKSVVLGVQTIDYSATLTTSATATTVAGWQTLTFTFPTTANYAVEWRRAWVAYDSARTTGGGNFTDNVYFYDDVAFNGATPAALATQQQVQLVTTFSQAVQYNFETKPSGWEAFEGASGDLVATPSGANAPSGTYSGYITESDTVGVQPWAGLTVDVRNTSELISATSKIVQLRVKAPTSTTSVTMKLEAPGNDPGGSTPNLYVQQSATAGTTSWQVLTFDFSSPTAGTYTEDSAYVKIVLFFNLNTKDPISQTFYFDQLAFTPNAVTLTPTATPRTGENKGNYPHIRLDKSFMDTYLDATWWDGVWQYRDEDTRAYLKYIPVRSTFKLTYTVTDKDDKPLANAPVTLIVNANYSCAKTFFMYENTLIGPDDCAGNGETQLPAKLTDADGKVTFVLTNTNAEGEKMPASLNGAPNGKELGTNIKPHLVGATREGVDMLFAHFVEQSDAAKVVAPATQTVKTGTPHVANFQFLDEAGKPMANQLAEVYINGVQSKQDWVLTDAQGRVGIPVPNPQNLEGTSGVAVSVKRTGLLPLTATTMVTWEQGAMKVSIAPASNSVEVKVVNAANESVKITINGKSYERTPTTGLVTYKFPATVGKKVIRVTIGKKTFVRGVTVRR